MSDTLLDKQETRIRRMFGAIAPRYDLLNHTLSLNIDRYWRWRTTRLVPPQGEAPILDVCTGTGDLALAFARAGGYRVPVVATDFCREMLLPTQAKQQRVMRQRKLTVPPVQFLEADTQRLPFADGLFQITSVGFGLRNVTNLERGLSEMVRVTRPGGRVAILEFSRPRGRVFGPLYRFYFRRLLPAFGQWVSRSPDSAYNYLPASVMEFPDNEALAERLRGHGLTDVRWHPFTFGIATLYVGTRTTA